MKKLFLVIFFIFMATGCSANYDLIINENSIEENVSITIPKSVTDKATFQESISHPRVVYYDAGTYYNMNQNEDNSNYYVNYSYSHDINNYKDSSFLRTCYNSSGINITDNKIDISTSNEFKCINMDDGFYMDSVTITIKTDLTVLNSNADNVNDNTYTWIINENNYQNKPIILSIEKPETNNNQENVISAENNTNDNHLADSVVNDSPYGLYVVLIVVIVLIIITVLFIKHKTNKANKI